MSQGNLLIFITCILLVIEYNSDIVKRCLKKDRRAQNELYKSCYNVMMTISWRYTQSKDEALEFMNAGFLKVIINLKKYKKEIPFDYWVRRVVINEVLDQMRKKKTYREVMDVREESKLPEIVQEDELTYDQIEKIEKIKNRTKDLPKMTEKVFVLYAFDGYKHSEIAKMLNISEGTSQWHYSTAKKKLKEWLAF